MYDTETSAMRTVEGGELFVGRHPGMRWEINFYERTWDTSDPFDRGFVRHSARLSGHFVRGQTFATPDDAAEFVRQLVSRRNQASHRLSDHS